MTEDEILNYYNPRRHEPAHVQTENTRLSKVGEFVILALFLPFLALVVVLVMITIVPMMWIWEKLKPDETTRLTKEFSGKGVRLIVGYDGEDKVAAGLAKRLEEKYGAKMESFDWSYFSKWSKDKATKEHQKLMKLIESTIEYEEDEDIEVMPPFVFSEDPCRLYAIALNEKGYFLRVSTYPVLNEWYLPTRVLPNEELFKRVNKALNPQDKK